MPGLLLLSSRTEDTLPTIEDQTPELGGPNWSRLLSRITSGQHQPCACQLPHVCDKSFWFQRQPQRCRILLPPRYFQDVHLEVPFSLAKWKRWALHYDVPAGRGISLISADCDATMTSTTHSFMLTSLTGKSTLNEDRNVEYLKRIRVHLWHSTILSKSVSKVPNAKASFIRNNVCDYGRLDQYPKATPGTRKYCRRNTAPWLIGIGGMKADGTLRHDGRCSIMTIGPPNVPTEAMVSMVTSLFCSLASGPVLRGFVGMGIRVNPEILEKQLELCDCTERKELVWLRCSLDPEL
jgi:aspartate--ammonia ligase